MNAIKINSDEVAKLMSEHAAAQSTGCRIDCNPDDGSLYFAEEAEEQGDDFTLVNFYHLDVDLTYTDDLCDWVELTIQLPAGMEWQ